VFVLGQLDVDQVSSESGRLQPHPVLVEPVLHLVTVREELKQPQLSLQLLPPSEGGEGERERERERGEGNKRGERKKETRKRRGRRRGVNKRGEETKERRGEEEEERLGG